MKDELNPMQRCGAHSRRTGEPCKNHPMHGKTRCRMHGAQAGRPQTTGLGTAEAKALRKECGEIRRLLEGIKRAGLIHKIHHGEGK